MSSRPADAPGAKGPQTVVVRRDDDTLLQHITYEQALELVAAGLAEFGGHGRRRFLRLLASREDRTFSWRVTTRRNRYGAPTGMAGLEGR